MHKERVCLATYCIYLDIQYLVVKKIHSNNSLQQKIAWTLQPKVLNSQLNWCFPGNPLCVWSGRKAALLFKIWRLNCGRPSKTWFMLLIKPNSVTSKRYRMKRFGPESVAVDKVLNAFEKVTRSLVPYDTLGLQPSTPPPPLRPPTAAQALGPPEIRALSRGAAGAQWGWLEVLLAGCKHFHWGTRRNLTSTHLEPKQIYRGRGSEGCGGG